MRLFDFSTAKEFVQVSPANAHNPANPKRSKPMFAPTPHGGSTDFGDCGNLDEGQPFFGLASDF
jgi:hypothetical protein